MKIVGDLMSTYCIGSDNIDGKELSYISDIISVLESKGHTCENLGVGPNIVQRNGLSTSSSGKIAVFIVGGSDIGTYVDMVTGIKNGYYHYKYCWFAFASWTASTWITCEALKSTPLVRAHDDNFSSSSSIAQYIGKPASEYFSANKEYINYVCGDSAKILGEKIAKGSNEDNEEDTSATSILEALKEVLSFWDGYVECYVINDTVYVNKIKDPEEDYQFAIIEGINIVNDSVNITDYNPNTINKLIIHWEGGEDIILTNDSLISRFGEKLTEMDAVKYITTEETETNTNNVSTSDSEDSESTTKIEQVPVETYEEAYNFAICEWNKIKRENGHTIECKVIGNKNLRTGIWCKVSIPSMNENLFMYISRVSHSDSGNGWESNITLVDYPPSFGEYKDEEEDEVDSEETDETIETGE